MVGRIRHRCGAHLNNQLDDYKYIWKCEECGHKNSISEANIYESEDEYKKYNQDK